jgi:hypothetical protein
MSVNGRLTWWSETIFILPSCLTPLGFAAVAVLAGMIQRSKISAIDLQPVRIRSDLC